MFLKMILLELFPALAVAWTPTQFIPPKTEDLKKSLTELQFQVTQQGKTEPAFKNEYWDHKAEGIYVDIVSGEPLFSSKDKFDAGTGWASFRQPLMKDHIIEKKVDSVFKSEIEIRSRYANSYLGLLYSDGPPPGARYSINSAALRFIPREKLQEAGYAELREHFATSLSKAVGLFAGGHFWTLQPVFDRLSRVGVISTRVGYVDSRMTVEVTFDPQKISYEKLLKVFWHGIDPFAKHGQFCEKGDRFKTAIFYSDDGQKAEIEKSRKEMMKETGIKEKVTTTIVPAEPFVAAEDHHQGYYKKNPRRYRFYRDNCGRDKRLKEVWGDSAERD